jgi:thiopeptide-type bacteriocin biosynthesis protein
MRRRPWVDFEEPTDELSGGTGWLNGRAAEVVVPLQAARPPAHRRRRAPAVIGRDERPVHPVGGEWLYLKLYADPRLHDRLLAGPLSEVAAELPEAVDRWFFIRYADPSPHLRLRFHGRPDRLLSEALPRLAEWANALRAEGRAGDLVVDTYRPEARRYGGVEALEQAEHVFRADSEVVLRQLLLPGIGPDGVDPTLLAAVSFVDISRVMLPDRWAGELLAAFPKEHRREAFRARRGEIRRLAEVSWDAALESVLRGRLDGIWAERRNALAAYRARLEATGHDAEAVSEITQSLLHMHHNRAIGINPASEDTVAALARGYAELTPGARAAR